ncbi:MAG TPA: Holliday junction branch migration protein RuvA [Candidatus Nanopelagicales bacterium]|nr:Holliday junction branch migration protein RuvA [Candidatus Nanopelagicales bacterium]
MIDRVRGAVLAVGPDYLSVDIGPLALRVVVSPQACANVRIGSDVEVHTALVVREDSWTLYGFLDAEQCQVFQQVQTVSGIGPRIALALVSVLGPEELRRAIDTEDLAALTSVPGIGKKGAQRIALELKDRIGSPVTSASSSPGGAGAPWRSSVVAGLTSLGWNPKEAEAAVEAIAPRLGEITDADDPDVGVLLKEALRSLDRS